MADITLGSSYTFNSADTSYISTVKLDSTHFAVAYVNSNGSAAMKIGTTTGSVISYGDAYEFTSTGSATTYLLAVAIDSTHLLIKYMYNSTIYVKTVTVSGNVITYGSWANSYNSNSIYTSIAVLDSTHIIMAFEFSFNSNYGTAVIGTISGDRITYGSAYVFNSAATTFTSIKILDSTHFILGYNSTNNSGNVKIGTITGSVLSFGSVYVFNNRRTYYININIINSEKFIIGYVDVNVTNKGTAIIGTISGSVISYGSPYIFNTNSTSYLNLTLLDSLRFSVAYNDQTLTKGYTILGNIDNNVISYEIKHEFYSGNSYFISSDLLDSNNYIINYRKVSTGYYGTSIICYIVSGKKINGITCSKWNGIAISKFNGI